jgi:hypothetical protein
MDSRIGDAAEQAPGSERIEPGRGLRHAGRCDAFTPLMRFLLRAMESAAIAEEERRNVGES